MSDTPRHIGDPDVLWVEEFSGSDLTQSVSTVYDGMLDRYETDEVIILKRFPTGIQTFTDHLAAATPGISRPEVTSLTRHARHIVEIGSPDFHILTDSERLTLDREFLDSVDWESEYLSRAAQKRSFRRDVGRLMAILSWQGGPSAPPSTSELEEIVQRTDEFHEFLLDHNYLDRESVVSTAIDLLEDSDIRGEVHRSFEAVLAVEFEEYSPIDRKFVNALSVGKELVCLSEQDSSIQRTWNEPGVITELVDPRHVRTLSSEKGSSRPEIVGRYLATQQASADSSTGNVSVIDEYTFEDQVRKVSDEISRLRRENGWEYNEFAVILKDIRSPLKETIRLIQQAGIPTASVTVSGFSDDPAVRELYTLARFFSTGESGFYDQLERAVPSDSMPDPEQLHEGSGIIDGFRIWLEATQLKDRIASQEGPLDARAQFGNVTEVIDFARFVEQCPLLESSWETVVDGLEEIFEFSKPDAIASEVDVKEDGVLVDTVRVTKNASWNAVFLLNVVESEYPSTPSLTNLFPDQQLREMEGYPGVTSPSPSDVFETFSTSPTEIDDPFTQYYAELSRRLLAIGSRSAEHRLYFGLYSEGEGATGKGEQPSRYLVELVNQFPWIEDHSVDGIQGQASAEQFALHRVDRALNQIHRAHLREEPVQLSEIESDLADIQALLETGGDRAESLRDALTAKVQLANWRVANE